MHNRKQISSALAQLSARSALSRRQALVGAAALGATAAIGVRPAFAKTTMTWMGWQGYETPILSGSFIADNDIDFQPTFISSNEEIITKLQAGGIGKTDLITMYFGYLPLMAEGELLEPINPSKIDQLAEADPAVRRTGHHQAQRQPDGRAVELGLAAADV